MSGHIMVVDDEPAIRMTFEAVLKHAIPDIQVDLAENGSVAVEKFQAERHALLLMDLNMPIMDGFAAFRRIKEFCENENINMPEVVFCTGYTVSEKVREAVETNRNVQLLLKPVNMQTIIDTVKTRLNL
jgi:CheY-like chemotaxis protein